MLELVERPRNQTELVAPQPSKSLLSKQDFSARWIDSVDELELMKPQMDDLAQSALWRNLSFEHNYLIPALKHLNTDHAKVLVIEAKTRFDGKREPLLCALMPLTEQKFRRIPIKCINTWKHDQCFDATPLLRRDVAVPALECVFDFLISQKFGLFNLDTVVAEGEFQDVFERVIKQRKFDHFLRESICRGAFRPMASAEAYFEKHVSRSIKKTVRRLERRLEELGEVTKDVSNGGSDFRLLAEQFLQIEASGWKGREGSALACKTETKNFYLDLIDRWARENKARMISIRLDNKPIAMISDLISDGYVCSYKTAYDDAYHEYSPGLQNALHQIESFHDGTVKFADSCTDPSNANVNRIWGQRVNFQSQVLALRPGPASWAVRWMPTMQQIARYWKRDRKRNETSQDPSQVDSVTK
jgi:hypothetical protein